MTVQNEVYRLLGPQDPPPATVENADAPSPYLLVCDHAGRRIPALLDSLGLDKGQLQRHIAWDVGAGGVARALGARLGAWTIRQAYSRLVVDCNRAPGHPGLIVHQADEAEVRGNAGLTAEQVDARMEEIHGPYHGAIAAELDRRAAAGRPAALVSVHSFTPVMQGCARPWRMGVLHDGASLASRRMLDLLRAEPGMVVGDNEPYAMDGIDYTIPRHAIARGLPYLELEIRQDLIAGPQGQAAFAAMLERLVPQAFAEDLA